MGNDSARGAGRRRAIVLVAALNLCAGCATNASRSNATATATAKPTAGRPAARLGASDAVALRKLAAEKAVEVDFSGDAPPEHAEKKPETKFELRLSHLDIDAKTPLEGTINYATVGSPPGAAPAITPELLKLLWVDSAQRVMGEFNVAAFVKEGQPGSGPIAFSINLPQNCVGQLHRLVLVRLESTNVNVVIPPVLLAQARFQVHAPQAWDNYLVLLRNGEFVTAKGWQKLRDVGVTAGACDAGDAPTTYTRQGMPFFSELVSNDENLLKPGKAAEKLLSDYKRTRDAALLQRGGSLFDDARLTQMAQRIGAGLTTKRGFEPLGWSLGDGLSLTPGGAPFDGDMSRGTLEIFQGWLQAHYKTLPALNTEWGTRFSAWAQVLPPTTDQALLPEKSSKKNSIVPEPTGTRVLGRENFAAWSDFRSFKDFAFARVLRELKTQLVKNAGAGADFRTGFTGVPSPTAFNGCDPAQLARVLDWAEEHDAPYSRELMRSFAPSLRWISQVDGAQTADVRKLWDRWMRGDCGCSVDARALLDDKQELSPNAKTLAAEFRVLGAGMSQLRQAAQQVRDPIAIYYSPRSLQLNGMLDCQATGKDWMERDAAYEAEHNSGVLALRGWSLLLEDLGYTPAYAGAEQLRSGALAKSLIKVLILPRTVALSDAEAAGIRAFATAGGVVIADGACGTFDGNGRRRSSDAGDPSAQGVAGVLDADFGILRKDLRVNELNGDFVADAIESRFALLDAKGKPTGPSAPELRVLEPGIVPSGQTSVGALSKPGCPALLEKSAGRGHFVYLNASVNPYPALRQAATADAFLFLGLTQAQYEKQFGKPTGGEALRLIVGDMLSETCPGSPLRIWSEESLPVRGIRQARYAFGNHELYAVLPQTAAPVMWVGTAAKRYWYDVRGGAYLGEGTAVKTSADPHRATVLCALPYKPERLALRVRRLDPRGSFKAVASLEALPGTEIGEHVFHLEVSTESGAVLPAYTETVSAPAGEHEFQLILGLNEPAGTYHLIVRDVETGLSSTADLSKDTSEYSHVLDGHH